MTELKNIHRIEHIVERYGLRTLIETGCYKGDGIEQALRLGMHDIHSCDISEHWIAHCSGRFPGAHLYLGPSEKKLQEMCQAVVSPALFWLDAHLPKMYGVDTDVASYKMPVVEEIDIIRHNKRHFERCVIIVDDTRIIKSDDNPRFTPGETICCEPVEGISISDITRPLENTHMVSHIHDHEGYIVFTPMAKYAQ